MKGTAIAFKPLGWFILSGSALFYSPLLSANLIDLTYGVGTGSFELGNYINGGGISPSAPGYMGVAAGDSSTITGWTVGGPGDGVDWLIEPSYGADTGVHSIDLQHQTSSSISTVIPTTSGDLYEISFSAAAVLRSLPSSAQGLVSAGSLLDQVFSVSYSADPSSPFFSSFSFLFTATGPTTTIRFTGAGPTGVGTYHFGPVIDTVSVSAVPEPGSLALLSCSGLFALLWVSNRKGKREA